VHQAETNTVYLLGKAVTHRQFGRRAGDLIAFIKMLKGQFYLGVMRPDGTGERLITNAYHVEGPTWAPNGRVLAYFKESQGGTRSSSLYTIDLTGHNARRVKAPADGSDPAWSPINP
jgi:TolB protein